MPVIYPPRPKSKIPPSLLPRMEKRGIYLAQRKFNGDRCLVHLPGNSTVVLYNRYGSKQKYTPPASMRQELLSLNLEPGKEYWLDGELMNVRIPDTLVLYDVLQAGDYLYGTTLADRLTLLGIICRHPTLQPDPPVALASGKHVWMAQSYYADFVTRFKEFIHLDYIEGLVLKEHASRLNNWGSKPYEVDWQIRCRKPGPNYRF